MQIASAEDLEDFVERLRRRIQAELSQQRKITIGRTIDGEMRYFRVVEDKVTPLVDLYDTVAYPQNWYTRRNPFETTKITPL